MLVKLGITENISWSESDSHWVVTDTPARIELATTSQQFEQGWILLRAKLVRDCRDHSAFLIAETDRQQYIYDIPVTLKGTILELFELPDGVRRLFIQPMNSIGTFTLTDISVAPTNTLKRVLRKWVRVLPLYGKRHRQRSKRAGLKLYTPLVDLKKAYQIAGRFRASPLIPYPDWVAEFDQLTVRDKQKIKRIVNAWPCKPAVHVIVKATEAADISAWQRTISSLDQQLVPAAKIWLLPTQNDDLASLADLSDSIEILTPTQHQQNQTDTFGTILAAANSEWLFFMSPGAELAQHTLFWFCAEALASPSRKLLYSDHDHLDADGQRIEPQFKPDWSPELLRSSHYIGDAFAVHRQAAIHCAEQARTAEPFNTYGMLLRLSEVLSGDAIYHIPAVLWHQPVLATGVIHNNHHALVAAHLKRAGIAATVSSTPRGHCRVRYQLPDTLPLISIIVPTRDMLGHLKPCIESVLTKTSYPNFELLIVDNQSAEPQTLDYFHSFANHPQVRVIRYDHPFNYSAINNFAVKESCGDVICLLNNDTEVITNDWLEQMLGHLLQAKVGCVGAKLYFGDGRVQHAGDTVGPGGCADHLHSKLERDEPGYMDRAILAQDLSAVTAACLMTPKDLFLALGGLDEINLAVAFNDVDYCLRVREAGHRVIFTPYAELYHHESVSRGKDDSPEKAKRGKREADYMRQRWKHIMQHDPFYNPNLSYSRGDFSLSHAPLVKRPW